MSKTEISFTVPGIPRPQGRPRATTRGKFAAIYQDKKTRAAQQNFRVFAMQYKPDAPFQQPLYLQVSFMFPRPKGHYGTGKNAGVLKQKYRFAQHTKRPDLTNLIKLVEDALNGVFWRDDSQIVGVHAYKVFGETPQTEVTILREE